MSAGLRALVRTFPSALLGYSGGVDSALLAVVLRQELGRDRVLAAIGRSASYSEAQGRAFAVVCDGTNADDLREPRPGRAAGERAGVRSPLAEAGLTKAEIREAS